MVFFCCNACGQSVKKNAVEKHWQAECPRCEVLSCLDCGRDFVGDDYKTHTSCVTEAEKYQGDLFKGEKGGISKGEKKQQEWLESVSACLQAGTYSPRISSLLKRILQYTNIPRKKAKFQNFVKNSINVYDQSTLDSLWDIFNEPPKTQVIDTPTESALAVTEDKVSEEKTTEEVKSEQDSTKPQLGVENDQTETVKRKGKKRKKSKCEDENDLQVKHENTNGKDLGAENDQSVKRKGKKRKRSKCEDENDLHIKREITENEKYLGAENDQTVKRKGKKRKRSKCEDENGLHEVKDEKKEEVEKPAKERKRHRYKKQVKIEMKIKKENECC